MFEDYLVSTAKYSPAHFRRRVVSTDLSADLLRARPKDKRKAEPEIVSAKPHPLHTTATGEVATMENVLRYTVSVRCKHPQRPR